MTTNQQFAGVSQLQRKGISETDSEEEHNTDLFRSEACVVASAAGKNAVKGDRAKQSK
jgi:hypothetical protein